MVCKGKGLCIALGGHDMDTGWRVQSCEDSVVVVVLVNSLRPPQLMCT